MSEKTFFHVTPQGALRRMGGLSEALEAARGGGYAWLDYHDPKREDLEPMAQALHVHPLVLEDCLDEEQIPKLEDYLEHSFLLFNAYECGENGVVMEEVDFILGRSFLATVSGRWGSGRRFPDRLEKSLAQDSADLAKGPDFLLHSLLDSVVDAKCQAVESVQTRLDSAEEDIMADLDSFDLDRLVRLRRELLSLRKSLFHEREVLVKICRRDSPFISEASIYHFRDIYDHLTKFFEEAEICREMILSLMEMYLSRVNNRMSATANRTNATVRRLTFITTIFMPLSFFAGVGGMSEWSMMTGPHNWRLSYPLLLAGMTVMGVATYHILKWIERRGGQD